MKAANGTTNGELVGHVEIVLRNALDEQLADLRRRSGDPMGEWFVTSTSWFHPWWTAPKMTIIDRACQLAATALVVHPGKVVAELTFGFWRYLLTARYEASLWTSALRHAFRPGLARSTVHELVEQINAFRNRVAHHEPIHSRNIQDDIGRWLSFSSGFHRQQRFGRSDRYNRDSPNSYKAALSERSNQSLFRLSL